MSVHAMAEEIQPSVNDDAPSEGMAVGIAPAKKRRKTKRVPQQLPPYKDLLHNDDTNTFEHVIETIVMLTPSSQQEALLKAIEAHEQGVSLLLTTHRERAELYQEQFQTRLITVTIEPA